MSRVIVASTRDNEHVTATILSPRAPVLASRHTVEVDDHLQVVVSSPRNGILQILQLPLDVRLPGANLKRPVPYRDPDVVQASDGQPPDVLTRTCDVPGTRDIREVLLRYPGVPVVLENGSSRCCVLVLTERPLINDGIVAGVVEKARSNPWLPIE